MYNELRNTILCGDALEMLKALPDACVQCCVTSPPYFGLRAYLPDGHPDKSLEIGLEETPAMYIEKLVAVFREVRRVLRSDGILWCNLGDSYAGSGKGYGGLDHGKLGKHANDFLPMPQKGLDGFKNKDLMMIPARVAIALCEDGWYLRSDVIWNKPTAMPESVLDRPTSAHEHIFLLAKSEKYFYDARAIAEPSISGHPSGNGFARDARLTYKNADGTARGNEQQWQMTPYRNKRNVWTINTQSYPAAHFATFPEKLVEPMVLAGSSPRACVHCNAPWERVIGPASGGSIGKAWNDHQNELSRGNRTNALAKGGSGYTPGQTIGWQPTCQCTQEGTGKCIVLDPFMGSGTTALVAMQQGREYLGIELNPDYIRLIEQRLSVIQPTLWIA